MKLLRTAFFASAVALAACSSTPTTTATLDQARGDFIAANNDAQVSSFAPLEFKQASDALDAANVAAAKHESLDTIDRLAYIAKQKIATARQVASQKAAEADIVNAGRQRDQLQLQARTAAADRARLEADRARMDANAAQASAEDAQRKAMNAQSQTREAQTRGPALETRFRSLSITASG